MSERVPLWTAEEAAKATGGKTPPGWKAYGVSIDTRTLTPGDLLIALKGATKDGHEFVADGIAKGAASALVSYRPADVAADAPLLMVHDTQAGLEGLGRASRARSRARIVAVTGSAGKTTTKEMLRLILSKAGSVSASVASFNNHWGVPLSLARMPRNTDYGVFELGMNHAGEIRALVDQVRPHVAVITTIAPAHLEYFGTVEAIADAKSEIFEGVDKGGAAILPADSPQFERLSDAAQRAGITRILSFGSKPGADARLLSAQAQDQGQAVTANIFGGHVRFFIGAAGQHIAMNAIAALLAARELGAQLVETLDALAGFTALKGRGARFAAGDIEVIDESYNANPASMRAALDLLGQTQPRAGGRRIAVLGDMLELGARVSELHRAISTDLGSAHADLVFLCGAEMKALWNALPSKTRGAYAEKSTELAPELLHALHAGDVVLVKGSFGSRMSVIIDALRARQTASAA